MELMEACDTYIPAPAREDDKPFLMAIEDTMTITGRGTVATGRVERGVLKLTTQLKLLVSEKLKRLLLQVWKCSEKY